MTVKDQDKNKLIKYLKKSIISEGYNIEQSIEYAYQFLAKNKIEPFQNKPIERLVRTAHAQFEELLFKKIYSKITKNSQKLIDLLLQESEDSIDNINAANLRV